MKQKLLLIISINLALMCVGCGSSFVEYQPIKLQQGTQNKLVPAPELLTSEHIVNVKAVLTFYGEPHKMDSTGKLLITKKLAWDKELLWNYTKKAEDAAFTNQHQKRPK